MRGHGRRHTPAPGRLLACALLCALLAAALQWALAAADCPVLLWPAPDAVMDNGRRDRLDDVVWSLGWSACDAAEAYQLVVELRGPFVGTPAIEVETEATTFTSTRPGSYIDDGLLDGWLWRVRAKTAGAWGPWSEDRGFSVEPPDSDPVMPFGPPAECPVPLTPESDAELDNGRTDMLDEIVWSFTWTPCPGASEYWLLAMREGARYPAISVTLAATHHEHVRLGDHVAAANLPGWWWRVRAKVDDVWQPWSEASTFGVEPPDSDPPRPELVTPALLEPADGATLPNAGSFPPEGVEWVFGWSRVPIADGYRLVVMAPHLAEPYWELLLEGDWLSYSCYAPSARCTFYGRPGPAPLPTGAGDWWWRVQARLGPVWGPWSEAQSFTVAPARVPAGAEAWLAGRLEGWSHGPGRIDGFFHPDWPPIGEGELADDGSFVIHLPVLALNDEVWEVDTDDGPVRMVAVVAFFVVQEETEVAYAVLATSLEAADLHWTQPEDLKVGDAMVMWWLAERAATRSGSEHGWSREDRLELDLRQGWNTVLLRVVEVNDDGSWVVLGTTVAEPPGDVAWHWQRFGE